MSDQISFVAKAQEVGEVGLALDAKTPIEHIKVNFEDLDTVLVMTIQAGFSGQKFTPHLLEKVQKLAQKELFPVEVDGGINDQTIKEALQAGATRFVSTSFLFGHENPHEQFKLLHDTNKQ